MKQLRDLCRETLSDVPGLVFLGKQDASHIVNLSLPGLRSQGIINCLQDHDIYVSAGSACSRGHRSHVLEAMHLRPPSSTAPSASPSARKIRRRMSRRCMKRCWTPCVLKG